MMFPTNRGDVAFGVKDLMYNVSNDVGESFSNYWALSYSPEAMDYLQLLQSVNKF